MKLNPASYRQLALHTIEDSYSGEAAKRLPWWYEKCDRGIEPKRNIFAWAMKYCGFKVQNEA